MTATEISASMETNRTEAPVIEVQESTIRVSKQITDRIERRLRKSEFATVDAYAAYILEEVLNELEDDETVSSKETSEKEVFSKEDQEDVEQRLRDLGYM